MLQEPDIAYPQMSGLALNVQVTIICNSWLVHCTLLMSTGGSTVWCSQKELVLCVQIAKPEGGVTPTLVLAH